MHTLRKLPTMQPKTKNVSAQNSNGTRAQICGSKIALTSINFMPSPLPSPIRWERENHSQSQIKLSDVIRRTALEKSATANCCSLSRRTGEGQGEGESSFAFQTNACHKLLLRARGASLQPARVCRSKSPAPSRLDAATCPSHSRFCSRRLWRRATTPLPGGDKSCRKPHVPGAVKNFLRRTAAGRLLSSRAWWR